MALIWFYALSVLFSFASCEAKPENCTQCKLLPVGVGFFSEFRRKASEKGVRLVYLNLKIGNDSYRPLELDDEFLPDRWVWANTINEPMLSLPEDYDILSLGLLNFQFRSMDVQLKDQPSGCLASLNSSCQNMAVGRMLLENVTTDNSGKLLDKTEVVCVAMIKTVGSNNRTENHCCGIQKLTSNGPIILCDLTVYDTNWMETFDAIVQILSFFMAFYIPALPLALPDCVFSLQYECDKEDRAEQQHNSGQAESHHTRNGYMQIGDQSEEEESELFPVDDASPMTLSTLLRCAAERLPDVGLSFNIKLAILLFCIHPCVFYFQVGLFVALRNRYILDVIFKKEVNFSPLLLFNFSSAPFFVVVAFTFLIPVLFLRPKDLILEGEVYCPQCEAVNNILDLTRESSDHSVGDEMHRHLKILHQLLCIFIKRFAKLSVLGFNPTMCSQCAKMNHQVSRIRRAGCVLWSLVCILLTLLVGVVLGAICLVRFLLLSAVSIALFSPFTSLFFSFAIKITNDSISGSARGPLKVSVFGLICSTSYFALFLFCSCPISVMSCTFITNVLGFVIMGFVLNADIVTPYAAFFLVVTTNIYFCYANLQNRYKSVKAMILKRQRKLHVNDSDPDKTIQSKLFWFVCDRAFSIKSEFCLMFRNVVLILAFLFFVVCSIVFFGNQYNVSAVFSTIAVVVSGVVPALVLKGFTKENIIIGWEKIKIEREIETAVTEFYEGRNNRNSRDIEGSQSHSMNNDDTGVRDL